MWVDLTCVPQKKEYEMNKEKRVTFRIEKENLEKLQNLAKKKEIPISMLLRQIIKEHLKNGNKPQKKRKITL